MSENELPLQPFVSGDRQDFRVAVSMQWRDAQLSVRFVLVDPGGRVVWPAERSAGAFRVGVWEETCFEVFLMAPSGHYVEWNLSPTRDYCYSAFKGFRLTQSVAAAPHIEVVPQAVQDEPSTHAVSATLDPKPFADVLGEGPWERTLIAAPTAVLMLDDGRLSHWALAHPQTDSPDFHALETFQVRFDPVTRESYRIANLSQRWRREQ